jgi:hypothetical protein
MRRASHWASWRSKKRVSGFLALRLDPPVPRHVTDIGLRLGQGLIGTSEFEVVHFTFEFYGHGIYHALVNPNNPLVRPVLACMVQTQDYVFFSINADSVGASSVFRSPLDVAGFAANFPRIERSTTTEEQYARTVRSFSQRPDPPGCFACRRTNLSAFGRCEHFLHECSRRAYYGLKQNAYGAGADAGCSTNKSGTCSGTEDVISFDAVYRLSKRFDGYAGVMYSGVHDGLAAGYLFHTTDITTTVSTVGVRYKF